MVLSSPVRTVLVRAGFWWSGSRLGPGLPQGEALPPPQSQSVSLFGELSASGSLYGLLLKNRELDLEMGHLRCLLAIHSGKCERLRLCLLLQKFVLPDMLLCWQEATRQLLLCPFVLFPIQSPWRCFHLLATRLVSPTFHRLDHLVAGRPELIKCRNLILNIQGCNWFDPKLSHVVHFLRERHAKMLSLLQFFASDAMRYIFRHDICPFLYTEGFSAQKFPP